MSGVPDRLRLGLLLPTAGGGPGNERRPSWAGLRAVARLAEQVGFDTLFVADHLLFRDLPAQLLPEGETQGVWEAWTILSAVAEATDRVALGPLVACTSFRNPALLAKMAATLDEVSGGRLILGLGAGWHSPEYDAFGYSFDHLRGRFEEALRIIVPLLRHGHVDFEGKYYRARDCELRPRGPRPDGPPIWIGASRRRMMQLVARWADGYNTLWHSDPAELADSFARLDAHCRAIGRDPDSILRTCGVFVRVHTSGDVSRDANWCPAAVASVSPATPAANKHLPYGFHGGFDLEALAIKGSSMEVAAQLHAFHGAGVRHITCQLLGPRGMAGVERFAPVIEALRTLQS